MLPSDLTHNQTCPRSHRHIYIMTVVGTYWSTFVEPRVYSKSDSAIFANSRANNSRQFWSNYIHNQSHWRSYGHIHFDQVWC